MLSYIYKLALNSKKKKKNLKLKLKKLEKRYYFLPIRLTKIKKTNCICFEENVKGICSLFIFSGSVNMYKLLESILETLIKVLLVHIL